METEPQSDLDRETTPEQSEGLDDQWYERLSAVGAFESYECLDGDREYRAAQKAAFLAGEIENPALDYPQLRSVDLEQREKTLLALKQDILQQETNETVCQVYRWEMNEKIAELRLLKEARAAAESTDNTQRERHLRRFNRCNSFVFGSPSAELFAYTVNQLPDANQAALQSENPLVRAAAERSLGLLPPAEKVEIDLPPKSAVATAQAVTTEAVGNLVDLPKSEEKLSADEIQTCFTAALQNLQVEGWQVIQNANRSTIHVSQERQAVVFQANRKLTAEKLRQLIAREIGTHVARRANGERSRLRLLGLALIATCRGKRELPECASKLLRVK